MAATNNLKAFSDRASEAEDRLERLEDLFVKKEAENLELKKVVKELQSKLEAAQENARKEAEKHQAELAIEKEKAWKEAEKLQAVIAKRDYRIVHLVRALTEAGVKRS